MHIFDKGWISTLKERADCLLETINHHVASDKPAPLKTNCDTLLRAAYRELHEDYLYCIPQKEVSEKNDLIPFRQHWKRGHPVIVTDVLNKSTGLSWEPMVMSRAIGLHLNHGHSSKRSKISTINCFIGCEEKMSIKCFFNGYAEGKQDKNSRPKLLKLKDFPPKHNFHDVLPRNFDEFIRALPFPEYTNLETGFLNLAAMLTPTIALSDKQDLGPKAYVSYGNAQELGEGDFVTPLHCDMADAVNILLHNMEVSYSDKEKTGGALWDIFRREDVDKLEKYLYNYYTEFRYPCGCPVDKVWNHGHLNNVLEKPFLFLPDVHTKCEISNLVRNLPWTLFPPKTYKNASE